MHIKPAMKRIIGAVALCVISFAPLHAASSKKSKTKEQRKTTKSVTYSATPFDSGAVRLPPNYVGHDLLQILQEIRVPREKGEFEKAEEYEARITKWKATPILGTVTPADTLAFEVSEFSAPDAFSLKYDPDQEELKATISFSTRDIGSGFTRWLETFYLYKKLGSHIGKTAMGVKFRVTSHLGTRIGLGVSEQIHPLSISKAMPRDEAMLIKPQVKAFAIVSLVEPYKIEHTSSITASLSEPDEWLIRYFGLHASLKAIWLVNSKTGEVLVKSEAPFPKCTYNICTD